MNYSKDLVQQMDGLGIDMSNGPVDTLRQLDQLYESTRYNTFGYLENLKSFDKIFEPVYVLAFFILVRDARKQFKRELEFYDLAVELREIHEQTKINKHEYKND